MSRFPRLTPSKLIALCLLLAGAGALARAQSLPGIKAPDESKAAAKQQLSAKLKVERGLAPLGKLYDFVRVDQSKIRTLRAPAPSELREEAQPGKKVRVGVIRAFPQPLEVDSDSALYRVAEGEARVLGLRSEGALMTRVHITNMSLAAGARLFVYSMKNPEEFYGPYEGRGPAGDGAFWSPPVEGDGVVVEYFNPDLAAASTASPFQVSEVSHIYTDPLAKATAQDAAGACNREVTSEWATVAKSVGLLQFTKGAGEYLCTGTLLNNQNNDFKPYLLTANHCFSAPYEAQTLRVYWNYNSGDIPATSTPHTDGASLLATGNESDFTFVLLSGTLPSGLFFSGWEVTPTPLASSVTGIHHPEGSHKRIAFGSTVAHNTIGLPGPSQNFTGVRWNSGITEPGSSGSGIWTGTPASAKLVGTLTGGTAACDNISGVDFYGSFNVTYPRISSFLARDTTPDDTLEQNDTRPVARAMENGTYRNLTVKPWDEDWYKITVPAGSTVGFRVDPQTDSSSLEMAMYRGSGTEAVGTVHWTTVRDRNTTNEAVVYYLRVSLPAMAKPTAYTLYVAGGGTACAATPTPISIGQTLTGTLSTSDCASATPLANVPGAFYADYYTFYGKQGQELKVTYTPTNPLYNTYLVVRDPTGYGFYADAPGNATQGSTSGGRTLQFTGTYTIEVSSGVPEVTGSYSVRLADARWNTVTIGKADYFVDEDAGHIAIPVSIGPTAEGGATVEYATSDTAGSKGCGESNPAASSRCDYVTTVGTLRFDQGETSKTIYVPLINDTYGETEETFTLTLRNSRSASLGTYSTAKIHINANDGAGATTTPIDQTAFFVRQHYLDFLGREPDPAGYAGWQDILNKCAVGDTRCDRIEVSSAFFRSTEFQGRAYFIYRFYSAALARIPTYAHFIPDMSKVSGFQSDAQLEANKAAFAAEFVTRPEFAAKYDALTTPTAYVNALVTTAGVTLPNKQALIDDLTAKRKDRAQVLRAVVESAEVYNKFYNEAFVVMQYHGYLRRDPDILYLDWIKTMNETGGDYRTMINGFMNSLEYRQRFGQ